MKMAVTIFGSTGCLRVHRLRSSFKLATPYLGCCESGSGNLRREIRACSAQNDHEQHPRCASDRLLPTVMANFGASGRPVRRSRLVDFDQSHQVEVHD